MAARLPQLVLVRGTALVRRHTVPRAARQLNLVLDDARFRVMTPAERRTALRAMARLLLEASGMVTGEVGDDNE